jgi:hypothetical protein
MDNSNQSEEAKEVPEEESSQNQPVSEKDKGVKNRNLERIRSNIKSSVFSLISYSCRLTFQRWQNRFVPYESSRRKFSDKAHYAQQYQS